MTLPSSWSKSACLLVNPRSIFLARPPVPTSHPAVSLLRRFSNTVDESVEQKPIYPNHVPLNTFQRTFLAIGSAVASLNNPNRAQMIATLSETTGGPFLGRLRDRMLEDEGGRRLLRNRPRINTTTVNLQLLEKLPPGTFGKEYCNWLRDCNVSPDTRDPVRFIDSPELAYVMQRYRECHDFYHVITGPFPVNISGEIVVKWIELANMGLPVAALSAIFGPLRLASEKRTDLLRTYVPWALRMGSSCKPLICVEWEKHWETPISQLKRELGISQPPVDFNTWINLHRKRQ